MTTVSSLKSSEDQKSLLKIESAKYAVLGNVDAGKSSTIGVLEKNVLDDGNGYARSLITKLKHEKDTGRTSTHTPHYLINGNEITTLVDLCGHRSYLKTTIFGVFGMFCDYGIIMVGANNGIEEMTREHFALLISNHIPFIIVLSKIDIAPTHKIEEFKKALDRIAMRNNKKPIYFEEEEKIIEGSYIKDVHREKVVYPFQEKDTSTIPVIFISNKTGYNISFLRELIITIKSQGYLVRKNLLTIKPGYPKITYPTIMYIDSTFSVTGIGIVLSGTVKYGSIKLGQRLFLGPINNDYIPITVKSIHNCISENVEILDINESGSIGIRLDIKGSFTRQMFSKGQIVTSDAIFAKKNTCYAFRAEVAIFNHSCTITNGYQTTIHAGVIRQTAKFKCSDEIPLKIGKKQEIDVKFVCHSEFLLPYTIFMFRDGLTRGIGRVISTVPFDTDSLDPVVRVRRSTRKRSERRKARLAKTIDT